MDIELMKGVIKILFIEDVATDLELVKRAIRKSEIQFLEKVVETKVDFINELTSFSPDIILSDYSLPIFNGMQALQIRQDLAPLIPFILVTGSNNEEIAVECIKSGADDYILKENLTRLGQSIKAAIKKQEIVRLKKEAEDALFESEELFRTAFENAAIGVCMVNTEGQFVNVNNVFCNILGYTKDEIMSLPFTIFTFGEDQDISASILEQLNCGQINSANFEKRYVHKLGHIVWVNMSSGIVHSRKTKSHYYVSYVQDITERKESEKKLIIAKEKAEESDRLKTAFLHNISHEIRTPMNAIVGFSNFLNEPYLLPEKRQYFTDIIVQSSNQLLSVITDLVNIATIEAGQEKVQEKEVNLNTTFKLLYELFAMKAQKKNIFLHYTTFLPDHEAYITTDGTKLIEILTNLIGNSIKFTNQGHISFGYDLVEAQHASPLLEFYVEDTGIGIPPEMHNDIFKRFRQVESSAARRFGGSGLGLSISKAYVELLGGKIWLHSELGKGSTFFFTIPYKKLTKSDNTEKQSAINLLNELKKSRTILVAEDEDSNFMLFEEILSGLEINILRAVNGIEAIQICKSAPQVDLVLMDIKMPEMDGYEATKRIKQFSPGLPIIAITAYSDEIDKKKAMESGCSEFISKPIDQQVLIAKIREQLSKITH